jgi:hypothetical protein
MKKNLIKARDIRDTVWDIYYSYVHLIAHKIQFEHIFDFIPNIADYNLVEIQWDMPLWNPVLSALRDSKFYDK